MIGRALLVGRLVVRDIKRRRLQSGLLLVMMAATTITLALGLTIHQVSQSPYERTRAATSGPDIVALFQPNPDSAEQSGSLLAPLVHARGVVTSAGPFPIAATTLTASGINVPVDAQGRTTPRTAVDRPALTSGNWVRPHEVVLEQGLADTLNLHVGDTIRLGRHELRVGGVALTASRPPYPTVLPGLVWVTPAEAARLASRSDPLGYELELKLANPAAAGAFWNQPAAARFSNATANEFSLEQSWQQIRSEDYKAVQVDQKVLVLIGSLLALLAIASVAVVVGGRMAEQTRRVGLLKAAGASPRLIALALLCENLLLGLVAAAIGLAAAELLAPAIANPGNGLIGSAGTPPLTAAAVGLVVLVTVAVAAGATILPAVRAARTSTIRALSEPIHAPQRRPRLVALSARLPVPLLFAVRLVARRLRRSVLVAVSLTIAVAMVVVVLAVQHGISLHDEGQAPTGMFLEIRPGDRVIHLAYVLSAILVVLAAINAVFTSWAAATDAERSTALARALGATPRQITAGLTAAQLLPGLLAAFLGIPAGLAIYAIASGHHTVPPTLWLIAVIPGTLLVVAALTALPARIAANAPVAEVLRTE